MILNRIRGGRRISVDNDRCERLGVCEWEAPGLFQIGRDGRLRYRRTLGEEDVERAIAAARCCPTQAIVLRGVPG